jgi:hypothetical protein
LVGYSARVSGYTTSQADETVRQAGGHASDITVAAGETVALAALRVGFGLMTLAAASDTLFVLLDGGGPLAGLEGAILTALAVGGLLRPVTAARLLRPRGEW